MGKIGLALAGGGARGAYQIGAWKALKEFGYDKQIDCFSGASVGSLNACLFAMGDYDKAKQIWLSLEKDTLFHIEKNIYKRFFKERLNFFNKGIYDTSNLERLMDEYIDYDLVKSKDVFVATTFLGDKRSSFYDLLKTNYDHYFTKEGNMIKYTNLKEVNDQAVRSTILASCAIPVAFQPITIDQDTFYDGGILDNTPIQPLKDFGCDKILVIDLFRMNFKKYFEEPDDSVYYINPKKSLRGVLDFDPVKIRRRFELGYVDTIKFIENNPDFFEEK